MINVNEITFTLPNGLEIIKGISTDINKGEFIVLLGGNGSGKSTFIKLLNRHYLPTTGSISLDGRNINDYSRNEYEISVITLTQFVRDSLFFDLTIAENAIMVETSYNPYLRKHFKKKEFLCELKSYLNEFNPKLAKGLHEPLYNLSGGEQQILAFALYLKHQPKLLLLDEHTSALDPKTAAKVMHFTDKIIKEKNLTCVMTTHNLDFALEYGSRVIAMNDGRLVYDSQIEPDGRHDKDFLLKKAY